MRDAVWTLTAEDHHRLLTPEQQAAANDWANRATGPGNFTIEAQFLAEGKVRLITVPWKGDLHEVRWCRCNSHGNGYCYAPGHHGDVVITRAFYTTEPPPPGVLEAAVAASGTISPDGIRLEGQQPQHHAAN